MNDAPRPSAFPDGHFYSPVVDTDDVASRRHRIWPPDPIVLGIDFNDASHVAILRDVLPRYLAEFDYPEFGSEEAVDQQFFIRNSQFSWLDCRILYALLRHWKPRRLVEIGSGFSTLLAADVNRRHRAGEMELICVEPYPRPFLAAGVRGVSELVQQRLELSDLGRFERLEPGDVLFIDSSHVAKTGSDVNVLYFDVLPRLTTGVHIHIHDVFLPHDYPLDWVLGENRSWNEQYVVRALLMYSERYRPVFGSAYAIHRFPDLVAKALGRAPGHGFGGGSLWIDVV